MLEITKWKSIVVFNVDRLKRLQLIQFSSHVFIHSFINTEVHKNIHIYTNKTDSKITQSIWKQVLVTADYTQKPVSSFAVQVLARFQFFFWRPAIGRSPTLFSRRKLISMKALFLLYEALPLNFGVTTEIVVLTVLVVLTRRFMFFGDFVNQVTIKLNGQVYLGVKYFHFITVFSQLM